MSLLTLLSVGSARAQLGACVGDCGQDGTVNIDELITDVEVALGDRPIDDCRAGDADGDGTVTISELLGAVRAALDGCVRPSPTATSEATTTATLTATASATATATETATAGEMATTTMPAATVTATAGDTATQTPLETRSPTPSRPNFIIIDLDDTRADGIDRMPTVQRIAAEGIAFRNSFTPDSVCCPSRASLLSGRYAVHHGSRGVSGPIGGAHTFRESGMDHDTIAVWLHDAGYRTGLFGKYLNAYDVSEADKGPGGTFYVPPGWDRWRAMMSPEHYGGILGQTYTLVDESGQETVYDDHTTDAQYSTDVLAAELRTFIAQTVRAGDPFFALFTPFASHAEVPGFTPRPAARHNNAFAGLPLWRPPSWNEVDISDKPLWVSTLLATPVVAAVTDVGRELAYESLLSVDEQLGATLDLLVQLGAYDHTVILLMSDNGLSWGEHRYFGGKGCPYEECLRVPLVALTPFAHAVPATVDAAVLNIDVAPTIAALAGVPASGGLDGESLAPWLTDAPAPTPRDRFLLERWREARGDSFHYTGQVQDGDRLRLQYGPWRPGPRRSLAFEFDSGDGVTDAGAIAVPIGADAETSFTNLGAAVVAHVPATTNTLYPNVSLLMIDDLSPNYDGVYWFVEVDQGGVIKRQYPLPDYFGIRDVASGYTYAEAETGEVELYDLNADPYQLDNKANDPAYTGVREQLAGALAHMLEER